MRRAVRPTILCVSLLAAAALLAAARVEAAGLFDSTEPLHFKLEAPYPALLRQRSSPDPQYENGRLLLAASGGGETAVDLRVRLRGKSRRAACDFPPLLLNFREATTSGTVFEGENRLKLVTHCDASGSYDQFVLLEYLSYKVLNLLTDVSLRARLVEVTYYDMERQREIAVRPAILLEDEGQFAARKGWQTLEQPAVERASYDADALALVELFQYFIGNTDWSAFRGPQGSDCCHNVVPFSDAAGKLWPVPYDFDSAGIVDPPHALPDERLPIRDVRQRLWRGPCRKAAELAEPFAKFQAQRDAIAALYREQAGLNPNTIERTLGYIDEFYARVADPRELERALAPACR